MLNVRRYVPVLLAIASCSPSEDTPGQVNPDGGAPVEPLDSGAPAKPKDAGPDARVLGPAVPVEADKLGCEGNMRIEGAPIDVTQTLSIGVFPDRTLVSFTDGTFGLVGVGFKVEAKRLDERLETLDTHPIAFLSDSNSGSSGNVLQLRSGGHAGLLYYGSTDEKPPKKIASLIGYDFATSEELKDFYEETVEGLPILGWSASSDDTASYAWVRLSETEGTSIWRRPFRKNGAWQRTGLDGFPSAQWQEGGKTHFLRQSRDVVLAADGKVESDTPFVMVPDTTTPCATGGVVARTGASLVTERRVFPVPCTDPARLTTPSEVWVHLPNDATGRKLATWPLDDQSGSSPVETHWGSKLDSFVTFDYSDPTKFTAKLQRLDSSLRDLGKPVTVTLPGIHGPTNLIPVAGGYYWLVASRPADSRFFASNAYHLVCAP